MQTDEIAAWLTQIWDEEAEAMRRVGDRIWFVCNDGHVEEPKQEDDPPFGSGEYERGADGEYRLPNHHNTWLPALDPASVLARIAADRQILEDLSMYCFETPGQPCGVCDRVGCRNLRRMASAYADRPGYNEQWRQ